MNVVIIEDEPLAQQELERIITSNFPQYNILTILDSVEESISWFQKNHCDLVFMDIQLTDGKSFDIFKKVEIQTPIIFTTAYDEYAIEAFKVNSIGYILKPIDENELRKAVKKLSFSNYTPYPNESIHQLLNQLSKSTYKERFVVKTGDVYQHITSQDIAYFYSEDKATFVVTKKNRKFIMDDTLDKLERTLDPSKFYRLSRNIISSADAISQTSKYFNSRLLVKLEPEFHEQVLISRVRVSGFLKWLGH